LTRELPFCQFNYLSRTAPANEFLTFYGVPGGEFNLGHSNIVRVDHEALARENPVVRRGRRNYDLSSDLAATISEFARIAPEKESSPADPCGWKAGKEPTARVLIICRRSQTP
jgi:hypothetical protein